MARPYAFTEDSAKRIVRSTLGYERSPRNRPQRRARWFGFDGSCEPQNAIFQIAVIGSPNEGNFGMDLTIKGTTESITFQHDDDLVDVKTALEQHSEIQEGDVFVIGGPFPNVTMQIEFVENLKQTHIDVPICDWNGFASSVGVGVITSIVQLGIGDE